MDSDKAWKQFVEVCDRDFRQIRSNPEDLEVLLSSEQPKLSYLPHYIYLSDEQLENLLKAEELTVFSLDEYSKKLLKSMIESQLRIRRANNVIARLKKI